MKKQNININNAFIVLYLKNFLRLQTNDFALCIVYVVFLCTAKLPLAAATQLNESIKKRKQTIFPLHTKTFLSNTTNTVNSRSISPILIGQTTTTAADYN